MSDEITSTDSEYIDDLRNRLDLMGIKYHPKAGVKKLTALLNDALSEDEPSTPKAKSAPNNAAIKQQQLKLVRVVVHCNDPNKSDYTGDIFTVHNNLIGTVTKYVPFGNTEGWHVPFALYEAIRDRKVQLFRKKKMPNGLETSEGYITNAFNIEVLDPLTPEELSELRRSQKERNAVS